PPPTPKKRRPPQSSSARTPMALEPVQVPDDAVFSSFRRQCESEEGWINKYSKSGVGVWIQQPSQDGNSGAVHKCKCTITIKDVAADTVYDVLHDGEYRTRWDHSAIETFDIARLTVNTDVGYYSWKCPNPLKNRDVVTLRSWLATSDDYVIINYSVKHPNYPPRKDRVRAVSHLAGYLVKPTGPCSCTLTYLAQVDPKGSLPKWFVNKASRLLAPKVLKKLYKACVKYPEWKNHHKPSFRPWLYPEQSTLPTISSSELAMQRGDSLENIDESRLSEVKEDQQDLSDEETTLLT
uniref:START domain-containing protein 10 n=1 Tax=Latimeria chalumnae TaxID=7897 RepID=H3B2V8_LATCH